MIMIPIFMIGERYEGDCLWNPETKRVGNVSVKVVSVATFGIAAAHVMVDDALFATAIGKNHSQNAGNDSNSCEMTCYDPAGEVYGVWPPPATKSAFFPIQAMLFSGITWDTGWWKAWIRMDSPELEFGKKFNLLMAMYDYGWNNKWNERYSLSPSEDWKYYRLTAHRRSRAGWRWNKPDCGVSG